MTTLRQFEYLVALADTRHFGRAAQTCHVSQPSLSQQLRALERALGVNLADRTPSGAELTPIGRELAERARRVLVEVKDIKDRARRAQGGSAGIIRFGSTPTLGPYLMAGVIATLHQDLPEVRLHIREGIPDEQVLELSRGRLDMLLSPLPLLGDDLEVEPLFRERLHIVAPPDHPLAKRADLTKADLKGAKLLGLGAAYSLHRQVTGLSSELGMTLLRDYEGTSLDSLRQMVGSGLGLTILPDLYVRSEVGGASGVVLLEIAGWNATRSVAAAWRRGVAYAELYRRIAEYIRVEALNLMGGNPWPADRRRNRSARRTILPHLRLST